MGSEFRVLGSGFGFRAPARFHTSPNLASRHTFRRPKTFNHTRVYTDRWCERQDYRCHADKGRGNWVMYEV